MKGEPYREWIQKVEGDFRTALRESKVLKGPNYDAVCYHAQQCIEKYLKAFRVFKGRSYKRVHALIPLLEDCIDIDRSFEFIRTPCDDITGIDQFRYPSDFANRDDALLSVRSARVVRNFLRTKLERAKRPAKKRK